MFAIFLSTLSFTSICSFALSGSLPQVQDSSKTLVSVKVKGTKRFTEDEVIAASGLQVGHGASDDDFKKAARTLGDTGAFSDIAYSFSYSAEGTKLELSVTDTGKFIPAHFEDFVWFSDDELQKAIRSHVPLFNGTLPSFGRLADEVSDALQTLLVQNGIPGHVDYLHVGESAGHIEAFEYSVSDVLVLVRNIEFTGAGPDELEALKAAAQQLPTHEYSRSRLNIFAEKQLLPVLHTRGFLKAALSPPQPEVVKSESDAAANEEERKRTLVDVTFAVSPGHQYKVSRVEWAGNKEFPTEKLQSMVHLKAGDPANTVQLANELAQVQALYGSRGYVNASLKVNAEFDDAAATAVLHIDVKEDAVYHMGELEFRGLDNSLAAKLREAWKLRPGEVYDASYLQQYLPEAHKLLPRNFDWDVASHVTANVRDKTVDVDLHYTVKAPK